jgi:hypothetical protein
MDFPGGFSIPGADYEWQPVSKPAWIGWTIFYVFTLWMYRPGGTPYLDAVHLVVHEAGHPLFSYAGNYVLTIAGGTVLQLFVPAALAVSFAYRGHVTGTTFCSFMFFNSFINVGVYMADARARVLPLVAPGMASDEIQDHDWQILFEQANLLRHDVQIGNATRMLGYAGMAVVIAWLYWMKKRVDLTSNLQP